MALQHTWTAEQTNNRETVEEHWAAEMSPIFFGERIEKEKIFFSRGMLFKTMVMQNHQASKNLDFKILLADFFTLYNRGLIR